MSYCNYCHELPPTDLNRIYHDEHYGFYIQSDDELFGRLILEINQAGLSWATILKKELNFRTAFDQFSIFKIAAYNQGKVDELLQDVGIIRNKLKINAVIYNANQVLEIQKEHGSFGNWLKKNHPKNKEEWVRLFKKNFKFVGGEIVNEFIMSIGFLPGAHSIDCPIYSKQQENNPVWLSL